MFKQIILFCLIAISFQVDNCDEPWTACSSCIDGYTLVEELLEGPYCIKDEKLAEIKKVDPNCLELDENDPSKCSVCTIDYLPSKKKVERSAYQNQNVKKSMIMMYALNAYGCFI